MHTKIPPPLVTLVFGLGIYFSRFLSPIIEFENSFTLSGVALNPGIWRMIFRKEILDCMQFQEIYMGEDQIFLFELRIWEKKVVLVEDSGYIYHKNRQLPSISPNKT